MRPVDKGAQGTYPFVVDVSSQTNLQTSLQAFTITFGTTAAAPVAQVFGTASPTAWDVLSGLLLVAKAKGTKHVKKKAKTTGVTVANVKGIKETLNRKLATMYSQAAPLLNVQLGRFCSFCELYNQTGVAVEHVAPKAPYPLFYIAWDNFLLACSVCNSNKLSKPPRTDPQFLPAPTDEVGYYNTLNNNYLLPNRYTLVYRTTKPQLQYQGDDGKWWPVTYPVADGTELRSADEVTRTIRADVRANVTTKGKTKAKWRMNVPVRVQVIPTNPRSTKMVELAALNKPSGQTETLADIRVWTRTLRWFTVLDSLNTLKQANATTFPQLWNMMMASVQQPGLYSVWVTVIDLLGPGGSWTVPGDGTPVMTKFLTTITGQNYFPGTDTADTP
ncbi:MAG TPA: hypothetical protein VI365_03940 [Trebonia sp.]